MRPITRHGNMPPPIAKVHKLFLSQFLTAAGDSVLTGEYVQVFECSTPDEVTGLCALHPVFGDALSPDFLLQCLLDRKTDRWYVVGLGLGQRITIGDIDAATGDIIPGEYEQAPVLYFAECTETWAKNQGAKKRRRTARTPMGKVGIDLYRDLLIETATKKKEREAKQTMQVGSRTPKKQSSGEE